MSADAVSPAPSAILHLAHAGVSVILDSRDGRLPAIVHWGDALDVVDDAQLRALCDSVVPVVGPNNVSQPPRVAVLPEHHTGWIGRPGIAGSFDGSGWSPRFTVTGIELDGRPVDGSLNAGAAELMFRAADDSGRLSLLLEVALLPSGLIRTRATLTNLSAGRYALEDVSLTFPVPAEAQELFDFTGQHNLERVPQRTAMRAGTHLRENRRGRTGADSAYLLHLGVPGFGFARGRTWAVHTAWSGNHRHYAERVYTGEQVIGGGEVLLPGEVSLGQDESYRTPWVYGAYGDGLDAIAHRFHALLRTRPDAPGPNRPVTLNVWEAVYFRHDADALIALADKAAALGVERYVLDDGWFAARRHDRAGLGDWVVSEDLWPDGLHPLVDRVHDLGMQFGLWFEPEMVNLDSDLARRHPEWIMAARDELPVESRFQHVLNIAHPGAYAHVRNQMLALLGEYRIDYIKWDHNRDLTEAGDRTRDGRAVVHEQTLAFYRLLRELKEAHPTLEIESCSSGGGRVDLAVLEYTDRVWVSDNSDPHDRQSMMRWTEQLVPPEYLGAHIASDRSHTTGRRMDLSFRAITALFGHFGIEWDLGQASVADLAQLTEWIGFHKEHRRLLLGGEVIRMDDVDPSMRVHGVVAPDRAAAIFAAAVLDSSSPEPPARLTLRGLDPAATYRIAPVFHGPLPSGLIPPAWWGARTVAGSSTAFAGTRLRGDILSSVGVASPRLHPDQAVLYALDTER